MRFIKRKGLISFIALIMIILSSLFVFYFMNMNDTHSLGLHVKHGLDRSTKASSVVVNEDVLAEGSFKIDEDKSKEIFEKLINVNLGTENLIKLSPIKQNNGVNYVFQYNGNETTPFDTSRLEKTPKMTYFVFNADSKHVSNKSADVEDFINNIKQTLNSVQISNNSTDDKSIKDSIMSELVARNMSDIPVNRDPKIKDTRSFTLAVAEIPINTFNGSLKKIYRFSTSRLNSKVDTQQDNTKVIINGLRGEYYKHEILTDLSGEPMPPTSKGEKMAERIDKEINFQWGLYEPHPNLDKDGFTVVWTGLVKAPETGIIDFRTITDDGVRLWVDNTLLIDKWGQQEGAKAWTGTISLTKDQWYPIKMEYYENTGEATAYLQWRYQGRTDYSIIPSAYLLPYSSDYSGDTPYYSKTFTIKEPLGIKRFGEILEVPIIFDEGKMVKDTINMTLLEGTEMVPFVMEDLVKTSTGHIKKGKLVFVDDIEPSEEKAYSLIFSDGITYIPPESGINVSSNSTHISVSNNNLYSLKFKKDSRAGYSQAYINGSGYDAIGEKTDKNFYFSSKNQESGYTDWGSLNNFKILKDNAIYTTIEYTVKDTANALEYDVIASYYKNSPIIKHKFKNTNISNQTLYSYIGGHAPMFERTSHMDGIGAWGVSGTYQIVEGSDYQALPHSYLATGTAYWSNQNNYEIGLHTRNGVAMVDSIGDVKYDGGRINLHHDSEQQVLQPNSSSSEKEFWMSVSHNDYLGDGKDVAQNITLRMANPTTLKTPDVVNILDKPDKPVIVPSKAGVILPAEIITFDIKDQYDQNGNPIIDVQWEGKTPNNRYRGGLHTIRARVKNGLGMWSDWAEYDFVVKFKVLEVYLFEPQLPAVINQLVPNQVDVYGISLNSFNSTKPSLEQYDMLIFGFSNNYGLIDLNDEMYQKVDKYINEGRGVLFTHDTISHHSKNFNKFARYFQLDQGTDGKTQTAIRWGYKYPSYPTLNPEGITKVKEGLLTKYPFLIPDIIDVQPTHSQSYETGADVWFAADPTRPQETWFAISNNNVVFLSSGHHTYNYDGTKGSLLVNAPDDEKKLIINTIFYTSQFRKSEIIEEPNAKISISGPNVPGVYYRGDTLTFSLYDAFLPNGEPTSYEWKLTEKFGQHRTFTFDKSNPTYKIDAPPNIIPEYEISVQFKDGLNVPSNWITESFKIENRPPSTPTVDVNDTHTRVNDKFRVYLTPSSIDPDGDTITYEWDGKASDDLYPVGENVVKVRAKDSHEAYSAWKTVTFVTNREPNNPIITVKPTRTVSSGKFFVNISASATDPDGDSVTIEWQGRAVNDYYAVGTHTIKARAKDVFGAYSDWVTKTFTVVNNPPSQPVIHQSPTGNISNSQYKTITATSSDPDGDAVTFIWTGRLAETSRYPIGRHTITVKARDAAGLESQQAAIVFFSLDPSGGGGMTLTDPESRIYENGIEGGHILKYTFNVPSVSGHSGSDYAWVKGYNPSTRQWEQIEYKTTSNGIFLNNGGGTLPVGKYTKLEFFYYASHCMYNKSNITYTVEYGF
ncbi:PA14 domain-containing protein [Alkaliphilus sp. B6464]|uniref:PA14 domain-containing protein n=1 Tax=Alkaliphilus sp. B6464 TaxID=2731219 RepID=UPI001BA7DDC0|nr:DUF5057 domain-containing protein [Alkaliphilus sp. B6464]QUH21978.1 DUF5057 domain-containing protein [Alkaliphilus sp. B6464]